MSTYFLISVPKGKSPDQTKDNYDSVRQSLESRIRQTGDKETKVFDFDIPELKVGNIDALIYLSDALKKTITTVEGTIRKVSQLYVDLHDTEKSEKDKKAHTKELEAKGAKPDDALTRFKWEEGRYPRRKPLNDLALGIKSDIIEIEKNLREKSLEYNTLCQKLSQMNANESGNLLSRDINSVIQEYNKEHPTSLFKPIEILVSPETTALIQDFNNTSRDLKIQPFMTTLYVVIPKNEQKTWKATYETLLVVDQNLEATKHFVVPKSSVLLAQDNDSCLNSIIVFTKDIEEFKNVCRTKRYTVRKNDPSTTVNEEEKKNLKKDQEKKKKTTEAWALTNFGEAFEGWLHLKCIQCFVESILRYGLPPDFAAMLILPKRGQEKKIIKLLCKHYSYLGGEFNDGDDDGGIAPEEKTIANEKFFPFVYLDVDLKSLLTTH